MPRQIIKRLSIMATVLVILGSSMLAQEADTSRIYIKMEIHGLACPYCAFGMEKELKRISGVENVEIHLEEGLAYISLPTSQVPSEEDLREIVTDAGFTLKQVEYSKEPFIRVSSAKKRNSKTKNSSNKKKSQGS